MATPPRPTKITAAKDSEEHREAVAAAVAEAVSAAGFISARYQSDDEVQSAWKEKIKPALDLSDVRITQAGSHTQLYVVITYTRKVPAPALPYMGKTNNPAGDWGVNFDAATSRCTRPSTRKSTSGP